MLAATDHLVVTYCGRDERTNAVLPPAVPLGELLDVVDATARTATGPARRQVLVEHPLQTFDDRNFDAGALVPGRPWSFDPVALDGALARWTGAAGRQPRSSPRRCPLPATTSSSSTTSCASSSTRCAPSCAGASACRWAATRRSPTTASRSSSTRSPSGRSGNGWSSSASPVTT